MTISLYTVNGNVKNESLATLTAATVNGPVTIDLRANRRVRNNLNRQIPTGSRFVSLGNGLLQKSF